MEPRNVAAVNVNGQVVYFAPGEVIAVGEAARTFVIQRGGTFGHGPDEGTSREVKRDGETVSLRRRTYRLEGLADSLAVVADARARGLRVQLNHVLLADGCCGCRCDPCCDGGTGSVHQNRANPYWANPYWANPYWANPYWANPFWRTTAVPTEDVPQLPELVVTESDSIVRTGPRVWILDTGRATAAESTSLGDRGIVGDDELPDQLPATVDGLVDPVAGHGTFIAGIIEELLEANCEITVKHVIEPDGSALETDIADAIYDLLASGADQSRTLLNLSFGGALFDPCDSVVGEAIADAQEAGVVVVASAGNEASCLPTYPANFPGVVAVGAVDEDGQPAEFTNVGLWVQACAFGVSVASTFFNFAENLSNSAGAQPAHTFRGWAIWSGTSFAAPVVVGAIAQQLNANGSISASEALAVVLNGGTEVPCLGKWITPDRVDRLVPGQRP